MFGSEGSSHARRRGRQRNGGAMVVYDAIIDDDRRENAFGLMMSLNMLIETSGGWIRQMAHRSEVF